tara:strand:- start:52 stop:369 length:318 start_codon:yes stop_codon:yes gene_type:complete
MKNLIKVTSFFAVMVTILISCKKEESISNQSLADNKSEVIIEPEKSAQTVSYVINRSDIEAEVLALTDYALNAEFLSENPDAKVTIAPSKQANQMTVTIIPNGNN